MCNVLDIVLNPPIFIFFVKMTETNVFRNIQTWSQYQIGGSAPKLMKGVKLGQKVFSNQELKNTGVNM